MSGQGQDDNIRRIDRIDSAYCQYEEQGFPAAYVLAALDGDELVAFRRHLAECAICNGALREFRSTVAQFPLAIEPDTAIGPSPELRERILRAVAADLAAERGGTLTATAAEPIAFPTSRRVPQAYAVAAVLLLALGLGLLGWNLNLQREIGQARAERDAARRELAVTRWQLNGVQAGQQITGEVLYLRDQQRAVVSVQGLPDLQPGQVYQVWLLQEGAAPRPETVFLSENTAVQADFTQYTTLAITIEPGPAGSRAPTSPILVTGSLT